MSAIDQAAESHWHNLPYWQANFPQVRLNAPDNLHVDAWVLRNAWTSQAAPPIVAVEILPRYLPAPEKPGALNFLPALSAIVGVVLPGTGALTQTITRAALTAFNVGAGIEHAFALQDWAQSFHAAPDDFGPQYSPRAFTVPMPLDRAQIMVSRPWYAPAMVYQFAQELASGQLRTTAAAYEALLQAMLPVGLPDPPPYTQGEAPLFWFVNPMAFEITNLTEANEGNKGGQEISSSLSSLPSVQDPGLATPAPASGGALPFLVAAGLLVAGAPIVLVVVVGAALIGLSRK